METRRGRCGHRVETSLPGRETRARHGGEAPPIETRDAQRRATTRLETSRRGLRASASGGFRWGGPCPLGLVGASHLPSVVSSSNQHGLISAVHQQKRRNRRGTRHPSISSRGSRHTSGRSTAPSCSTLDLRRDLRSRNRQPRRVLDARVRTPRSPTASSPPTL